MGAGGAGTGERRGGIGRVTRVAAGVLLLVVSLILALLVLLSIFDPAWVWSLLAQPPKKDFSDTQRALRYIERAAEDYRTDTGRWPLDDGQSTFLYKLMGEGKRAPYLCRMRSVYETCEVYSMTSPTRSPWAASARGAVPAAPAHPAHLGIKWPEVYGSEGTPPAWDEVPRNPAICPWLATDVLGYDMLGGQYRVKIGLFGYTVYSDGRNLKDNGGHWDDIHAGLTPGTMAAYHPGASIVLLLLLAAAVYAWYRVVFVRVWWRFFVPRKEGPEA